MRERFIEGGWGMWPILVLGIVALGLGLRYALTGDGRLRGSLESLARCVLFMALAGFATGLIATCSFAGSHTELPPATTLIEGIKESMNNLALGFLEVALVHLQLAVGRRREDDRA
jgi:hypothetical protein